MRGFLTEVRNSELSTSFGSFDALGRVTSSTQATAGQVCPFGYQYNLDGSLQQPNPRVRRRITEQTVLPVARISQSQQRPHLPCLPENPSAQL